MKSAHLLRRLCRFALALVCALPLSSCFIAPGQFTSRVDLRKSGAFQFAYNGDIHLLGLTQLAEMGSKAEAAKPFEPQTCFDDDLDERECTKDEIAQQKKDWEEAKAKKATDEARERETFKAMFGGLDPASPEAADELAARLRKQYGWRKVENLGNGHFKVDYAIAGTLSNDLVFPTLERFAVNTPFVTLIRRNDNSVRIEAPAFATQTGLSSLPMMAGAAGAASAPEASKFDLPKLDGNLTVVTDGEILANNTDEGPTMAGGLKTLVWKVTPRTNAAPMALIRLQP